MQTIQLSNIFKQQAHQTILKDFTLTIPAQSNIGIQMSHVEATPSLTYYAKRHPKLVA
ncbi:hypothetical protein SNK12g_09440 [Lactiplantibacillus plantarum]|uniref:hypothetical protein n=1 Tax=Lactiplantibacillus plantarum TaxID=1590 RepID=UPI0034E73632